MHLSFRAMLLTALLLPLAAAAQPTSAVPPAAAAEAAAPAAPALPAEPAQLAQPAQPAEPGATAPAPETAAPPPGPPAAAPPPAPVQAAATVAEGASPRILILPAEFTVYQHGVATLEPVPKWTEDAQRNLAESARRVLAADGRFT